MEHFFVGPGQPSLLPGLRDGPDHQEEHDNDEHQKKKSGKRKIEIKPITNKTSKQVTFSKRRSGLFKKASELCSLCGAEVAVITFSGAGKVFSFGHPTADDVIYRYINFSDHQSPKINQNNGNLNSNSNVGKISEQYKEVLSSIDLEKRRITEVGSSSSNGSSPPGNATTNNYNNNIGYWWDVPIDDNMELNELEQLKVALEGLRVEVKSKIDEINKNCSALKSVFPGNTDLGSSDGNNNVAAAARGYEDSANWVIPSLSPIMVNSLFGHTNNASENLGIFQ